MSRKWIACKFVDRSDPILLPFGARDDCNRRRSICGKAAPLVVIAFFGACAAPASGQSCGWSHIDRKVSYDNSGAWNPTVYRGTLELLSAAQIGAALWYGADSEFGKTAWQGIDAEILSSLGAQAGKYVFTRTRPISQDNPCLWFQGKGNYSFPSGEAAVAAGLVTPYVLQYGSQYPLVYGLLAVPLYVGAGRIKNQAHWQTDVLAGWAVGGAAGWYAHSRDIPITVRILPHSVTVGFHQSF